MDTPKIIPPQNPPYKTHDLQIAVVLCLSGFFLLGTEKIENRLLFIFRYDERIPSVIAQFYGGQLRLDPKQIFEVWKGLRTLTFSAFQNPGASVRADAGEL